MFMGRSGGCDHCPIDVSFITSYRTQHITKVSTYYLSLLPPLGGGLYVLHMGGVSTDEAHRAKGLFSPRKHVLAQKAHQNEIIKIYEDGVANQSFVSLQH